MARQQHPSDQELADFGLGRTPAERRAELERHVAACQRCCEVLSRVPGDSLVDQLRHAATIAPPAGNTPPDPLPAAGDLPAELQNHPRYRILGRLGHGGMGTVYRAEHRMMARQVALKVMNPELTRNPVAAQRFRQEVVTAARLNHRHIVAAYDAELAGELHLFVMELVEGRSLAEVVARHGPLPVRHACHWVRQAALGLQHAHERSMVHRDIKPQNLMLTRDGVVKILDFGLARFVREQQADAGRATDLTRAGMALGTPDYIAPEQASDARGADIRADLYSLGCTLYFLLTGEVPFPRGTLVDKLVAHRTEQPRSIRDLRPDVPPPLAAIVARLLAKDPAARFATPAELAAALEPLASEQETSRLPPAARSLPVIPVAEAVPGVPLPPAPAAAAVAWPEWMPVAARLRRPGRFSRYLPVAVVAVAVVGACVWAVRNGVRPQASGDRSGGPPAERPAPPRPASPGEPPPGAASQAETPSPTARTGPPRVLLVIPFANLWYEDYQVIRRTLERAGVAVEVGSSSAGTARPSRNAPAVAVDLQVDGADAERYAAVVFLGAEVGYRLEFAESGPPAVAARRLIAQMLAAERQVSGICRGNDVLATAGVLRDRPAAANRYTSPEIRQQSGAQWQDAAVVDTTGQILTGGDFTHAEEFARRLLARLAPTSP